MVAAAARQDLKMDSALSEKLSMSMVDASTLLIPLDTEVERAVRTEIAALKDEPAVLPASVVCVPAGVQDPYGGTEKDFDEVVNLALLFADRLLIALSDLAAKESVADPVQGLTRMLSNF
jgi:protein-tyrosine-phosphatase